jgi:hypothetical protein
VGDHESVYHNVEPEVVNYATFFPKESYIAVKSLQ